jgi:hypothetical protein
VAARTMAAAEEAIAAAHIARRPAPGVAILPEAVVVTPAAAAIQAGAVATRAEVTTNKLGHGLYP